MCVALWGSGQARRGCPLVHRAPAGCVEAAHATCGCGQFRVTTAGEPDIVIACCCRACQRRTGSPFGVGAYFRKKALTAEGEVRVYTRVADSGMSVSIRFCPECGNSVYWFAELRPDHYGVAVGCFTEPGFARPTRVVWNESRHPWIRFPDGVPVHAQGAPRPQTEAG